LRRRRTSARAAAASKRVASQVAKKTSERCNKRGTFPANEFCAATCPSCGFDFDALHANRATWEALDVATYSFDFAWNCFCFEEYVEPVTITVTDGEITEVTRVADGLEGLSFDAYKTFDELFEMLIEYYDEQAYSMSVSYDDQHGYPTAAWVDQDLMLADEERGFSVSNVQQLS